MRALTSFLLDRFALDGYAGLDELLLLNELLVPDSGSPMIVRREFKLVINPLARSERTINGHNAFSVKFLRAPQEERSSLIAQAMRQYLRCQPNYMTDMQLAFHRFARISSTDPGGDTMDSIVYLGVPFPLSLLITPLTVVSQPTEMSNDLIQRAQQYLDKFRYHTASSSNS